MNRSLFNGIELIWHVVPTYFLILGSRLWFTRSSLKAWLLGVGDVVQVAIPGYVLRQALQDVPYCARSVSKLHDLASAP